MKNRTIVLLLVPLILLLLPILQAETTSGETYRCRNPNACKEIDDVWKQIAPLIVDNPNMIWDPQTGKWREYEEFYPSVKTSDTQATITEEEKTEQDLPVIGTPPVTVRGKEWKAYQESIKATQDAFGPENVERFPTLRPKTVTVEKPDYNGNLAGGSYTIALNPGTTCPNGICYNDIHLKQRRIKDNKQGILIHATEGNTYLGTAKSWNDRYSAKASDPIITKCKEKYSEKYCFGHISFTHYILGREGKYIQHASEFAATYHSSTSSKSKQVPAAQWDYNTVAIEVSNGVTKCTGICNSGSKTYKGVTATDCDRDAVCRTATSIWGTRDNYKPQSDLEPGRYSSQFSDSVKLEKYSDNQMKALIKLTAEIMIRHNIHIDNVARHADHTWRKTNAGHTDPGSAFDWMGFKKSLCLAVNGYYGRSVYPNCNTLAIVGSSATSTDYGGSDYVDPEYVAAAESGISDALGLKEPEDDAPTGPYATVKSAYAAVESTIGGLFGSTESDE